MRTQCCVIGCKNYTHNRKGKRLDNGVQFFIIPAWRQHHGQQVSELTKRRRMAWVSAIKQPDITFNSTAKHFVCSQHFLTGKPADEMLDCDTDWTPTLCMGHTEEESSLRKTELLNRRTTKLQPENFTASAAPAPQTPEVDAVLPPPLLTSCDESSDSPQVGEAGPKVDKEFDRFNLGRNTINSLLEDYRSEKKKLCISQKQFNELYFKGNDDRVEYYTGLPSFKLLMPLVGYMTLSMWPDKKLSTFQQFVLTLMRLRLDWPNVHLAHMFGIDPTNADIIFKNTIDVLFSKLQRILPWPDRDDVCNFLPREFEEVLGKRYVVILNHFEIETEDHEGSQTFIIGFAPHGAPIFVSKGFIGCEPDTTATLMGFFRKLKPRDMVLSYNEDHDSEKVKCIEMEDGSRYALSECEKQKIGQDLSSNVPMVVESVRKFNMLNHTIPACFLLPCEGEDCTWLDKIVYVCCLLATAGPSVEVSAPGIVALMNLYNLAQR